jgi:hypothetical protein
MKRALTSVLLLIVLVACRGGDEHRADDAGALTGDLWVHLDDEWQRPPKESGLIGFVPARVLRFDADGTLSLISCALLRTERETFISPGDGLAFYFGRWHATDGRYVAEYVKVWETVHASTTGLPFERKLAASLALDDGALLFDGVRFERKDAPSMDSYNEFRDAERREYANEIEKFLNEH